MISAEQVLTLVDLTSNAVVPVGDSLLFRAWPGPQQLLSATHLIFGLGVLLCALTRSRRLGLALDDVVFSTLAVLVAVGFNLQVMLCLVGVPWVIAAYRSLEEDFTWPKALLALLAVVFCVNSAGYLFGASMLAASLAVWFDARQPKRTLSVLILFIGAGIINWQYLPALPKFDYPSEALLVPDDGIPGIIRPLIGPSFPQPLIDTARLSQALVSSVLIWAVVGTLLAAKRARSSLLIIAACIVWDLLPTRALAESGPLAAVSRLIPGLFLYPVVTIAWACWLVALILNRKSGALYSVLSLALLGIILYLHPPQMMSLANASPSLALEARLGKELPEEQFLTLKSWERLTPSSATITTSENPDAIKFMTDGRSNTRWFVPSGHSASIQICFPEARLLAGIKLDTGSYASDFPYGVTVQGFSSATDSNALWTRTRSPWLGAIQFTPLSHPYYGSQADVVVALPEGQPVKCLKISNDGARAPFDWSVAELWVATQK